MTKGESKERQESVVSRTKQLHSLGAKRERKERGEEEEAFEGH